MKHLLNEKKPDLYAKFEEKMKATPGRKVAVDTYQPMVKHIKIFLSTEVSNFIQRLGCEAA